jgi:two-component system, NarL family, nitrate/nitrite response regulator NarL
VARHCMSIVIADRQPVVLYGLLAMLRAESDFNVVASCHDGASCIQSIRDLCPDLALLDIAQPGPIGFQVLAAVKVEQLSTRVVYLSPSSNPSDAAGAIAKGAYGVIPKEAAPELLLRGLRQVASGLRLLPLPGPPSGHGKVPHGELEGLPSTLTQREREIMQLVCASLSNKEIGRELSLSDGTIKIHLHHIYQKLAIHNRTALACLAVSGSVPAAIRT